MEIDRCGKLHNNKKLQKYISRYRHFREQVASGLLEKTAQFWISYMRAVKVNDLLLYAHYLHTMSHVFFAFDC